MIRIGATLVAHLAQKGGKGRGRREEGKSETNQMTVSGPLLEELIYGELIETATHHPPGVVAELKVEKSRVAKTFS